MISRTPRTPRQRSLTGAKLALAAVGVLIWAYGLRGDDPGLRWVGIAFLAAAFLARFLTRRAPPGGT
jgi:hypothetical protein